MNHPVRLRRSFKALLFVASLLLAAISGTTWAGGPPPPTISTACGGYPCGVSQSALLEQVLRSGTYATFNQAMAFVNSYFQAGFGHVASAPGGGTRFALGDPAETGKAASAGSPPAWNAWVSGARANVGTSFEPLKADGNVKAALLGVDYTFSNQAILGVALADTRARVDTPFNGGNFSADGTTVSPYLLYPLNAHWAVNAGFGIGRATLKSLDNTNGVTLTGQNKSDTTLANLGIEYNQIFGNWALTGRAGASTYRDKQSGQTLSDGTVVPGSSARASQLRLGGEVGYNAGVFVPYAGLTYIRDTKLPAQSAVSGQTPSNDKDAYQLALGIQYRSPGPLYGNIQLATERGRSQFKNDVIMFNLGAHF